MFSNSKQKSERKNDEASNDINNLKNYLESAHKLGIAILEARDVKDQMTSWRMGESNIQVDYFNYTLQNIESYLESSIPKIRIILSKLKNNSFDLVRNELQDLLKECNKGEFPDFTRDELRRLIYTRNNSFLNFLKKSDKQPFGNILQDYVELDIVKHILKEAAAKASDPKNKLVLPEWVKITMSDPNFNKTILDVILEKCLSASSEVGVSLKGSLNG